MTTPAASTSWTMCAELTAAELHRAGLLQTELNVQISRLAIFVPGDGLGALHPITVRSGAVIGAFAVVHGGTTVGAQARIEEHTVVGKPELGYALGQTYPGVVVGDLSDHAAVLTSTGLPVDGAATTGHRPW